MSAYKNPFDPDLALGASCPCGEHASRTEHDAALAADASIERLNARVIESAVMMRALFPRDATRRRFIRAVGAGTALSALSSVVPFGALEADGPGQGARWRRSR